MGLLQDKLFSAFTDAIAEAGATLTTGKIGDKLGDKVQKSLKTIKKHEDKLYRTRNASASVIKNRMKKINEAQKDLVKNMSKLSADTAATDAIETTTVKIKKEAVDERE